MRQKIVAGNWKMNKVFEEGIKLIEEIVEKSNHVNDVNLILSPPYIFLNDASKLVSNCKIEIAAQNCASAENGAYTGEISAALIHSLKTKYVILGNGLGNRNRKNSISGTSSRNAQIYSSNNTQFVWICNIR